MRRGSGGGFKSLRSPVPWLWIVAGVAIAQMIWLLTWYWPGSMPDTNTSGVWIALADDVARGNFYRPLWSELGTGGTRYMPLFFLAHGGLIALGAPPLGAGVALTLGSAAALILACAALLRELGVPREIRWPAVCLMCGTVAFQLMLLTVRGDFLAAACNVAGVASALSWHRTCGRRWLLLAALLFGAAFLTKLTTVFGLAAVVGWLVWARDWRRAMTLAGLSGALMIAGVCIANLTSHGRMLAGFRAVAGADGTVGFALTAPMRMLIECVRDPFSGMFLLSLLVCGGALAWERRRGRAGDDEPAQADRTLSLVLWFAVMTLAATLVIFTSPGTSANHLIDVQAIAVIVIALALSRGGAARRMALVSVAALGLGVVATWIPGVPSIPRFFERHHRPEVRAVHEFMGRAGPAAHPMLSENPLIPILAGERPLVADWFNLRLMVRQDAALRSLMLHRLRRGEFGSIVLPNWPGVFPRDVESEQDVLLADRSNELFGREDLPDGFAVAMQEKYRVVLVRRPYVYLLRNDLQLAPTP